MNTKHCLICNSEFKTPYARVKVCSHTCKLTFRRSKRTALFKKCAVCGHEFEAIGNARTCSNKCSIVMSNANKQSLKKISFKQCLVCQCEFKLESNRAKTCSLVCSKAAINIRINNRYHSDFNFKLSDILRSRLNKAIKNNQKAGSAVADLGCSIEELKIHLESQFQEGMSWGNYGLKGWHIDHIKPLASFDLTKEEELKEACHYTNLQPLWAEDNLSKGAK